MSRPEPLAPLCLVDLDGPTHHLLTTAVYIVCGPALSTLFEPGAEMLVTLHAMKTQGNITSQLSSSWTSKAFHMTLLIFLLRSSMPLLYGEYALVHIFWISSLWHRSLQNCLSKQSPLV